MTKYNVTGEGCQKSLSHPSWPSIVRPNTFVYMLGSRSASFLALFIGLVQKWLKSFVRDLPQTYVPDATSRPRRTTDFNVL